ncbi:AfsA-related hotdog domain-containing protein [Micromonospora sp. M12]
MFFAEHSEFVPGILLVEAIRQTSLLAVQRTHGYDARRTHVTRASVRFPADATLDLPSTCTAQAVPHDGDLDEGPTTRIRTEVRQLDRVVAEAELTLTHTG